MVEDTPNDLIHDLAADAVFGRHPLGRPVIGTAEVISSVSKRALASYHRRAYQDDHIVLAAAGNDLTYVHNPDLTHGFIQFTRWSHACHTATIELAELIKKRVG